MKAFIVLALVAATAARSLDMDTLRWKDLKTKEDSLLWKEKDMISDKLFNKWTMPKKPFGFAKSLSSYYPYSTYGDVTTQDFDYDTVPSTHSGWFGRRVNILSIDEVVEHPLFQVFYRLPYFRQYWTQYPTVFRRYIESPLFQQFWTEPEFQQYFINPVLFYKYVVPQVQLFSRVEPFGHREVYGDRDVQVGDYVNKMFDTTFTPRTSRFHIPYVYNKYNTIYNTEYPTTHFGRTNEYKYLLDKMYRNLFVNKPVVGETEVKVEVVPVHKELVVDPVTGERKVVIEKPKVVDVQVDEKIVPTTDMLTPRHSWAHEETETDKIWKHTVLKRLLVTKVITPELYTVLKTLPVHHVRELVHRIVRDTDFNFDSDVYNVDFDPTFDVDVNDVFYRHKINPIISELYNKDVTGDRYNVVLRDLLKVLKHRDNIHF
jgi:hypothetical protein